MTFLAAYAYFNSDETAKEVYTPILGVLQALSFVVFMYTMHVLFKLFKMIALTDSRTNHRQQFYISSRFSGPELRDSSSPARFVIYSPHSGLQLQTSQPSSQPREPQQQDSQQHYNQQQQTFGNIYGNLFQEEEAKGTAVNETEGTTSQTRMNDIEMSTIGGTQGADGSGQQQTGPGSNQVALS